MAGSGSGSGSASASASGESKRRLLRSLDYLFVSRLRLRRLLAFLYRYRYDKAFEALSKETNVYFRVDHLQLMVQQGLWSEAIRYVLRFVPAIDLSKGGNFLVVFINVLSTIAAYKPTDPVTYPHRRLDPTRGRLKPGCAKVAEIIRSACSKEAWGSINWVLVRFKAAEIVGDLFTELPEFIEMSQLPSCHAIVKPANVLPVRASSRGHSRFHKSRQIPAAVLARFFEPKKGRTDSSNHQGTSQPGSPRKQFAMTRMAELIDECLQAGKCLVINDKHHVESTCTEGMEDPTVTEAAVPRNNLKRPRATEHQEVDERKIHIIGEHVQRRKRKPNTPISTATLRRSPRLANALDRHKPEAISASKKPISRNKSRARKITLQTDLLGKHFSPSPSQAIEFPDLSAIDKSKTSDSKFPKIPITEIQRIATEKCCIAPSEVTAGLLDSRPDETSSSCSSSMELQLVSNGSMQFYPLF